MKFLDRTLPTPEANLACDEALLDYCEESYPHEVLRFWEPLQPFLALGYSNKIAVETNELSCAKDGIPILRRSSGGGAVVQAPGCLNYALILRIPEEGPLTSLTETNCHVMSRNRKAMATLAGAGVEVRGTSDLALQGRKISGNAQRRKRSHLLFHGTILLSMDLGLIEKYLARPSREPDYRRGRRHTDFVQNVGISADKIKSALRTEWGAESPLEDIPSDRIDALIALRYSLESWNRKF